MAVWKIADRTLSGDRALVMAILNVTPDSFSDGGRFLDPEAAVSQACAGVAGVARAVAYPAIG